MMTRGIISRVLFHGPEVLCKCSRKFEIPGSCNLDGMVVCEGEEERAQLSRTRMTESPRRNLDGGCVSSWLNGIERLKISPRPKHLHLADEAILVNALALAALGLLGPHLLHVLEDHVAVSVKCLDTGEELAVVTARDQDLGVRAGGGL